MTDESNGYESIAALYIKGRGRAINGVGASTAHAWAKTFAPGCVILDAGCGTGIPVTNILLKAGLAVYAIDSSPAMVTEFRNNFPNTPVVCEPVERSAFFNRLFDGIISIGLMFLLPQAAQQALIYKMARSLNPGGKLLFTSPFDKAEWNDAMTGRPSISLGAENYRALLLANGLVPGEEYRDEGGNYYFSGLLI